jgi:hypothetical protein
MASRTVSCPLADSDYCGSSATKPRASCIVRSLLKQRAKPVQPKGWRARAATGVAYTLSSKKEFNSS